MSEEQKIVINDEEHNVSDLTVETPDARCACC